MESQIQIQSEAMEIVIPSGNGGNGNGMDRSRRQQPSPITSNSSPGLNNGQQKHQKPQVSNISRILIVSPSVQQQQSSGQAMVTRSSDRKHIAVSQSQPLQSTSQMHHQVLPQRQIVIQHPTVPQTSSPLDAPRSHHDMGGGQQQMTNNAAVQNGQLVITNLTSENRNRPRPQQQQMHRQQQILIIQQPDAKINEHEKIEEHQTQEHSLPMSVAQTITVAVSDPEGRGSDGSSAAIYPALQYVTNTGDPTAHPGAHHIVAAHHHSSSAAASAGGAQSATDVSHVIYHHSPAPTGNQHAAVHLQSGAYTVYPGDAGGYSPQGHHYYTGQVSYQTPLHSPTSTYIIQSSGGGLQHSPGGAGPCNPVLGVHEEEAAAQQLSHTTRASPATIQWLLQNYETAEGVSLPRCTLYNHYLKHCSEHKLDPVNAASFGKLIRSVFLGLRTRRLGTRGNSKYHYYGIRIKPDSPLNRMSDDSMATMAMRQQPTSQSRRPRPMLSTPPAPPVQLQTNQNACGSGQSQQPLVASSSNVASVPQHSQPGSGDTGSANGTPSSIHSSTAGAAALPATASSQQQPVAADGNKQYVGDGAVPDVVPPPLDHLESSFERLGLTAEDTNRFFNAYRSHCEDILDSVKNLVFSDVERCWRHFWQPDDIEQNKEPSSLDQDIESDLDEEDSMLEHNPSGLTRMQLYSLCTLPVVQEYVQTMDFQFYQVIVDVLIPNVLKPIPSALTQSIRNFAKRLESGLGLALHGAPDVIVRIKLDAVGSLAQTLRRYTSLNHLAQAARAVLQNSTQIQQMLTDLNRVDFHNVQEQASWVCDCDPNVVDQIEKDFKSALERQKTLEQWGVWLETVVDQLLGGYDVLNVVNGRQEHDASVVRLTTVARQFLLKWSFYSSMVMRDLTLRSAPSFGSFHLIRLLYDEYMFYLVEQRVARLTGQTTIAVMSQSYRNHVASLASSDQDYQAYQLQQLQEEQLLSQDHEQCDRRQEAVLDNAEAYQGEEMNAAQHHFIRQQASGILDAPISDDGDASLTAMDRPSSEAVVVMTQSQCESTSVLTIPVTVTKTDAMTTYVLTHNPDTIQQTDAQMDDPDEPNVVDEYFITIQEEQDPQQLVGTQVSSADQSGHANAALVLSAMASVQSAIDWGQQQGEERNDCPTEEKTTCGMESSPPKKRKLSSKFNGETSME